MVQQPLVICCSTVPQVIVVRDEYQYSTEASPTNTVASNMYLFLAPLHNIVHFLFSHLWYKLMQDFAQLQLVKIWCLPTFFSICSKKKNLHLASCICYYCYIAIGDKILTASSSLFASNSQLYRTPTPMPTPINLKVRIYVIGNNYCWSYCNHLLLDQIFINNNEKLLV